MFIDQHKKLSKALKSLKKEDKQTNKGVCNNLSFSKIMGPVCQFVFHKEDEQP